MAAGRPTLYDPKYVDEILDYFNVPSFDVEISCDKEGNETQKRIPNSLPTLAGFACKIGVDRTSIWEWSKKHPEFSNAIKLCKDHQERILVDNALLGRYDKTFSIFTAKNLLDWRDRHEVQQDTTVNVNIVEFNYEEENDS